MALEHWLAFAALSAVLVAIPGAKTMLVVTYALGHGRRTAFATVTGIVLGDAIAMTVAALALIVVMAASTEAYAWLRMAGGIYLVYLAIRFWRAPLLNGRFADNDNLPEERGLRILGHAFNATALNPRNIAFFVSLMPQFVDPTALLVPQLVMQQGTFLSIALAACVIYALTADRMRVVIRRRAGRRPVNRNGRKLLITGGTVTAGYRKIAA